MAREHKMLVRIISYQSPTSENCKDVWINLEFIESMLSIEAVKGYRRTEITMSSSCIHYVANPLAEMLALWNEHLGWKVD